MNFCLWWSTLSILFSTSISQISRLQLIFPICLRETSCQKMMKHFILIFFFCKFHLKVKISSTFGIALYTFCRTLWGFHNIMYTFYYFQVISQIHIWGSRWSWAEVYEQVIQCTLDCFIILYRKVSHWNYVYCFHVWHMHNKWFSLMNRRTHEDMHLFSTILNQEIQRLSTQVWYFIILCNNFYLV